MGPLLFRACLVINAFNIATENPVTTKPYRFPVYPVNECPRNKDEFKTAAQRRNCTKGLRYLCAPNKYLSSLIEFCTDRQIGLYQEGNCVILEGTGDLDHYSCVDKFSSSCPLEFYNDEEIYKYPACLEIDRELRCFAADNGCKKREYHTTESNLNISKMETVGSETFRGASRGWLAISYIIATAAVLAVIILSWIIFQKRKREQVEKCKDSNENESLLKDNPEIDDDKLRQFLSKGEITVCHIRCIIVGCGKAGKTTLLKRLQNVSFDELMQIERTEMVDFHVNSFEVLLEEDTIKSVEKEDTLPTVLFSKDQLEMPLKENDGKMAKETHQPGIRKRNVSEKSSLKNTTLGQIENIPMVILKNQANNDNAENEETLIFEPHSQDTTLVQNQFSPEPNEKHGEDIDANVDKIDFEKFAISKIKDAVNELLNEKELRPRITFLDFAGQSMYYAFHQIFLRPKSCSILVVDMTKSLYDKVGDQDKNEKECSRFASWRYKDYYKFWLKSIDSFSDTDSPVIIVGTHADKLSKEECHKFLKSLNELFDNWSHSGLGRHLNEDRMYTTGFPDSGSELEDLKDLKKCIANVVKCPRYSKENIRPVWALFEHILNKMKETEKVIPRKTLSDYSNQLSAQEFRIDELEISKMLVFFHRVGVLLYFDKDGLKEKIILDIQWLLDAFKCIIEYPVRTEENDMKRRHFCRTGELDSVELDRIWHIQGKNFLKHKTTIIAYMQQLGLLMQLKELHSIDSTVYYFPSMNSKRFDKTGEHNSKSSILCFKFDDEMQLPINVFHGIVLKCSKLNNWSILTEGAKNNICLYQNAACFSFQKHIVVLCNCNFEIRVQVWASPKIYDGRLLKKIKHSVEDIIHDDDLSYEIGYKCRKDVLNVEEDVSFISQNIFPVSNHLCEICDIDKKHEVDNDICWALELIDEKQDSLASNFVDSGGTCNAQMEGQKDVETSVHTWIEETDTVQANSDLVSEIGFLPNSEKTSVTHRASNRQIIFEAEHTNVLYTRCHNDSVAVSAKEIDSGADTIQNIEENALPEIPGVRSRKIMTDKRSTLDTDREEPKIESTFEEMLIKGGHTSMKEEVLIIDPSLDTSMTEKHETSSVTGTIDRDMKNRNSELQEKAKQIGPWAENIESGDLHKLFGSFCIKMPEDPDRLSFTKDIFGESKLTEFVEEIRSLARNVVLYKYLRDEEKKPGTVYVYEVNVKYTANQVVIEDKDARQKLDFFQRKNQNLVKVILIKGGFHMVLQAKKKAYQKYKQYVNFERFYLHHESEEYTEVAKLSAHRKVVSYKEFVESVRDSIPLQHIENIVKDAVNRALSKESITELCFDVVIQESGNINSNPYYCRSGSTLNKLKEELIRKTVDSVSKYLGSEICNEIQRHIETEIQSRLSIDTDLIYTVLNFSKVLFLEVILIAISYMMFLVVGGFSAFLSVVGTPIFAVNVNSQSWRIDVANEIYQQVYKNKEKVVTKLSSNIRTRCKITADHLKMIADLLEEFISSIHLNEQDTRLWEEG